MQGTDVTLSYCSLTNSDNSFDGIVKVRVLISLGVGVNTFTYLLHL